MVRALWESPLGMVVMEGDGQALVRLDFAGEGREVFGLGDCPVLQKCATQLEEYFAGRRKVFDIPIRLEGTPFRLEVWAELLEIGYGSTCSYKDVAQQLGKPTASRAVGGANNKNPISIIVPCHRVIGKDGGLTGYGGGLWRKEWLLDHEKKFS